MIFECISDNIPLQMKILNIVIPILMHFCSLSLKDLGQSPIQSAQILTACCLDNAYLTTMFLCLNKTVTFSVPTKIKIF